MSEEVVKQISLPLHHEEVGTGNRTWIPVVHDIITSHGGTILVDTPDRLRTRFEIRIPSKAPARKGDER